MKHKRKNESKSSLSSETVGCLLLVPIGIVCLAIAVVAMNPLDVFFGENADFAFLTFTALWVVSYVLVAWIFTKLYVQRRFAKHRKSGNAHQSSR
ncbi:MAG: hypothetical protein AAF846_10825 [Chloroflexota bacterium]